METMDSEKGSPVGDATPLGALLIDEGLLTDAQLDAALAEQARSGKPLGRLLIESGNISEAELVRTLARQVGLEFVDLNDRADRRVGRVARHRVAGPPLPGDPDRLGGRPARRRDGRPVERVRGRRHPRHRGRRGPHRRRDREPDQRDHRALLPRWTPTSTRSCRPRPTTPTTRPTSPSVSELVEDAPIVKFVNLLVTQAVGDRASDIHVEPAEHDLRIRFRIDGVLHEVMRSPRSIQAGVISRLKVMADINIAERRIPQDGRISMKVGGRGIDLRVATLPTVYGEKVVMRILDKGQAVLQPRGARLPARDAKRASSRRTASRTARSS